MSTDYQRGKSWVMTQFTGDSASFSSSSSAWNCLDFIFSFFFFVLLTRINACFYRSPSVRSLLLSQVVQGGGGSDKVRMIGASGGPDERQTCRRCCRSTLRRSISQHRASPFCRLVIHLDNITAMKRSAHSLTHSLTREHVALTTRAHTHTHTHTHTHKKIAMNYMNKLRWKVLIGRRAIQCVLFTGLPGELPPLLFVFWFFVIPLSSFIQVIYCTMWTIWVFFSFYLYLNHALCFSL